MNMKERFEKRLFLQPRMLHLSDFIVRDVPNMQNNYAARTFFPTFLTFPILAHNLLILELVILLKIEYRDLFSSIYPLKARMK